MREKEEKRKREKKGKYALLLHQTANHTNGVVQTALRLVQHQRVGAAAHNRHRVAGVLDARHLDDARAGRLHLLDQVGRAELVLRERVNVGDWLAPGALLI